jgi:transcription initiation factor IIE alpha subunit
MAKVIGYDEKVYKRFTCGNCGAIVEYAPNEIIQKLYSDGNPATDEGCKIKGLKCPGCNEFHRTNP